MFSSIDHVFVGHHAPRPFISIITQRRGINHISFVDKYPGGLLELELRKGHKKLIFALDPQKIVRRITCFSAMQYHQATILKG